MFRARPVRGQSLNSPSQQKPKVSATPSLRGFAGEPVPASFPAQIRESGGPLRSICAAPSCATGLRPPAPGGAPQMNRWGGSAPHPTPTSRANKS
jgi:hypothetical protein